MDLVPRTQDLRAVQSLLATFPVTAILGPRQCGKTTLAQAFRADHSFDLENPRDVTRLEQPQLALEDLTGLIVIDESREPIQKAFAREPGEQLAWVLPSLGADVEEPSVDRRREVGRAPNGHPTPSTNGCITVLMRHAVAYRSRSASSQRPASRQSRNASTATSTPILWRNLKQSTTVLAAL